MELTTLDPEFFSEQLLINTPTLKPVVESLSESEECQELPEVYCAMFNSISTLSSSPVLVRVVPNSLAVLCAVKGTVERQGLTAIWKKHMESSNNRISGDSNALSVVKENHLEHLQQ